MHRYDMSLAVRREAGNKMEAIVKVSFTTTSEVKARRMALEIAWASGYLVSCFHGVRVREV